MTRTQLSDLKRNFIEDRQLNMKKTFTASEKRLYESIFEKIVNSFEVEDGNIVTSNKNLNATAEINAIFKQFNKSEYSNIIARFSNDLGKIVDLNSDYFRNIADETTPERFNMVNKEVKSFMSNRIGLKASGEVASNSYLDRLIKDETFKNKIKDKLLRGVTNKVPMKKLVSDLQTTILGNDKVDGGLVQYFNQHIVDTYNQFDRTTSKIYAERLNMKYFVYQGGKIKTSRKFCLKHDGKCFTTDEAKKWEKQIGVKDSKGKPIGPIADKSSYNPLVDCGGYRCRHSLDFISASLAKKYRPDLFK
jgi:hypothetical protein